MASKIACGLQVYVYMCVCVCVCVCVSVYVCMCVYVCVYMYVCVCVCVFDVVCMGHVGAVSQRWCSVCAHVYYCWVLSL